MLASDLAIWAMLALALVAAMVLAFLYLQRRPHNSRDRPQGLHGRAKVDLRNNRPEP